MNDDQRCVVVAVILTGSLTTSQMMKAAPAVPPGRIVLALYDLERRGVVSSQWLDGPYPRKREYWLTAGI